jgi:hypothetical protein
MDREKIRQALEEVYAELAEPEEEDDTYANLLEGWDLGFDYPVIDIADTVIETVNRLAGKRFAWYWEPLLRDEYAYSGEFAFIMVDPETRECLTFNRETLSVAIVTALENIEQAIDLVQYLLKLAGVK